MYVRYVVPMKEFLLFNSGIPIIQAFSRFRFNPIRRWFDYSFGAAAAAAASTLLIIPMKSWT